MFRTARPSAILATPSVRLAEDRRILMHPQETQPNGKKTRQSTAVLATIRRIMAQDIRWQQRFDNYQRALRQLSSAVELSQQRPLSDLEKQGVIQAFEFVHELAWNVLKDFLEYEGIVGLVGSRSTVREAFKLGLLADGQLWMDMIAKRNQSSHTYNQALAEALVEAITQSFYPAFVQLQAQMQAPVSQTS